MSTETRCIFYTYVQKRSFIEPDLRALRKTHKLTVLEFPSKPRYRMVVSMVRQFFHLLIFGWKYDMLMCFFAGYHSVLPAWFGRLTGKPCIIFLAGTDGFNYPSFRYGNFTRKGYGWATCTSARSATLLAPVSSNLVVKSSPYYKEDSIIQGIYHWCKKLNTPHVIIPFEYDPHIFNRTRAERKANSFITISLGVEGTTFIRKGIDKIIMIANHCPDLSITIVGTDPSLYPVATPSNITLIGKVPHNEIPDLLSAHQFYLQLSIAEGFPNALCEAMLCECIPIGSEVAAIPEIIDNYGFLVSERNDHLILSAIQKAIDYPDKELLGRQAREHIVKNFGPGRRINSILSIVEDRM